MPNQDYQSERREYEFGALDEQQLADHPFDQFADWMTQAHQQSIIKDPTAMSLSTVDKSGQPHSRIVLLKSFDADGFVFYTNYNSAKGQELSDNAKAALLFFWPEVDRQIRIEGSIAQTSPTQSADYFHSRPRGSQLAALISEQSQVVANRQTLENRLQEAATTYQNQEIPALENWGGYRLTPHYFEFWQGRPNRLHDRFRYQQQTSQQWHIDRLSP